MLGLLNQYIDPSLSIAVFSFITMYFYLIMFNMMGYTLYQYHEALGYSVDVEAHEHDNDQSKDTVAISPELRAVEILIHEGKTQQAVSQLQQFVLNNPNDMDARERILKLLRLVGDKERHQSQGRSYISYLMGENKLAQAAKIVSDGQVFDKNFKPEKASERVEIANYFSQHRQGKLAMALVNNLHRDFPTYEGTAEAYMMVATLLVEQFNDDERAIQVLQFILSHYPTSSVNEQAKEYLRILERTSL